MRRAHAAVLAVLIGLAAVAGAVAITRTVALGPDGPDPAAIDRQVARRTARIQATEAALRAAMRRRPPALPARPRPPELPPVPAAPAVPAASAPRTYEVAAPSAPVVAVPRTGDDEHGEDHGGGDEHEQEGGDGWDD